MKHKIYDNPAAMLDGLPCDGMTILSGGFGRSGHPERLIPGIRASGAKLPLTGRRRVDPVITDLAVIACDRPGLRLIECAPGVTADAVRAKTGAGLTA